MCRSCSVDLHLSSFIDFSAKFLAYRRDVAAARGAGIPSIFSGHEKTTNASQGVGLKFAGNTKDLFYDPVHYV
jgi:hypothetical protein